MLCSFSSTPTERGNSQYSLPDDLNRTTSMRFRMKSALSCVMSNIFFLCLCLIRCARWQTRRHDTTLSLFQCFMPFRPRAPLPVRHAFPPHPSRRMREQSRPPVCLYRCRAAWSGRCTVFRTTSSTSTHHSTLLPAIFHVKYLTKPLIALPTCVSGAGAFLLLFTLNPQ